MNPKTDDPVKPVGIGLRGSLLAKAKVKAELQGRSVSDYISRLIEADLAADARRDNTHTAVITIHGGAQ